MQPLVDFILIDGNTLTFANMISFYGFTVIMGTIAMICQALARPTIHH